MEANTRGDNMALFDILKGGLNSLGGNMGNLGNLGGSLGGLANQAGNVAANVGKSIPGGMGGLLGAGALGALLGSMISKKSLKNAALVGAGAVAWNFYQKWAQNRATEQASPAGGQNWQQPQPEIRSGEHHFGASQGQPAPRLALQQDATAMLLLRAMVFAARADGHIDASERERIAKVVEQMLPGQNSEQLVQSLLAEPLNPGIFTSQVTSTEQGEDLYRLSCLIVDIDHFMERSYMDGLAHALSIPAARKAQLEDEANQAKQQLASV